MIEHYSDNTKHEDADAVEQHAAELAYIAQRYNIERLHEIVDELEGLAYTIRPMCSICGAPTNDEHDDDMCRREYEEQ